MEDDNTITRLISRPDGSESLLLRCARLTVIKGSDKGREILIDRPRVRIGSGAECELQLTDPAVSRQHLELSATERGYLLKDLDSTNGTLVGELRLQRALLTHPTLLQLGDTTLRVAPTNETTEIPLSNRVSFGALLGQSNAMRQVFAVLEKVAKARSTVLLEGESGTGKELAAAAIHEASSRSEAPLIVVDCGAIPVQLIESELFGHERGAFTGAEQPRPGAIEEADGGTLFLDEIGELPMDLQPRLLRFLENQQVKRVGATTHREVDVRVIAATNRHLAHEVQRGRFRQDLYYRMAVVRVEMPPLRERVDDIILLAHHFAENVTRNPRSLITDEIATLLRVYSWPGNARELRNVVEQLALIPEQALSTLRGHLDNLSLSKLTTDPNVTEQTVDPLAELPFHEARSLWQDRFVRRYLTIQLERASGVVSRAAVASGLPRQTFHRLMRKHRLKQ